MSKLIDNYIAVNEGRLAKSEFLRQTRQAFPQYISQFTSYDDAIQIFKNKGLLTEEVLHQCKGDRFPLEQIEKGIEVELLNLGINPIVIPSPAEYLKAKMKAIDNLCKDELYYVKNEACCCDKCKHTALEKDADKYKPSDKMTVVKKLNEAKGRRKQNLPTKDKDGRYPLPGKHEGKPITDSNIDWTENRCKIAYVIAKYGVPGIQALEGEFGVDTPDTREEFCFKVLGASAYASQCAVDRMKNLIKGSGTYFESAVYTYNFVKAYNELVDKELDACLLSINPELEEPVNDDKVDELRAKSRANKDKANERQREIAAAKRDKIEAASRKIQSEYNTIYVKHHEQMVKDLAKPNASFSAISKITSDKVHAEFGKWWTNESVKDPIFRQGKVTLESPRKTYNYQNYMEKFFDPLDSKLKLQEALKKKYPEKWQKLYESAMTKLYERKSTEVDDAFPKNVRSIEDSKKKREKEQQIMDAEFDKLCVKIKPTKAVAQVRDKYNRKHYVPSKDVLRNHDLVCIDRVKGDIITKIHETQEKLRTAIKGKIVQILSEAATANLARLSDQNASIQGIPAILNNLENVVTEIESFIIKERTKIQSIIDNIGNIKNEDNIPIGYKFVNPILDSFKKDLQPVLSKIDLNSLKLPQAPEMNDEMYGQEEELQADDKANIYAPKGRKPQLDNIK